MVRRFREEAHRRHRDGRFAPKPTPDRARDAAAAAAEAAAAEADAAASEPSVRSVNDLMDRWERMGVDSWLHEDDTRIVLSKVVVPKNQRQAGLGTEFMTEVCEYADATGRRVELSPSPDFGGSKTRLVEFYKRFGFVENKGRNRDFEVSESMYRLPDTN